MRRSRPLTLFGAERVAWHQTQPGRSHRARGAERTEDRGAQLLHSLDGTSHTTPSSVTAGGCPFSDFSDVASDCEIELRSCVQRHPSVPESDNDVALQNFLLLPI